MLVAEGPPALRQPTPGPLARRWARRQPGWALWVALVLYPLWWALGLGAFEFTLAAIPMAWRLLRNRPIKLPPAFGIWLVFLFWSVLSLVMFPAHAPNTTDGSLSGRTLSVVLRLTQLATVTIFLLYLVNLTKEELPQRRVMKWLGFLFLVTIAGGYLGLAVPHFEFTAPIEHILPHFIVSNSYVSILVHPAAAQVQSVLGFQAPRPAAPWGYTNTWGNNISILLVWFCVYLWHPKVVRNRIVLTVVLALAVVPIVYSLNRGLWFGVILSAAFLILRLARSGDLRTTLIAVGAIVLGAGLFVATPLNHVVTQRASHGQSNQIRAFVDGKSFDGGVESPLIGWGDPRKAVGSSNSIGVGPSAQCPQCGQVDLGSAGEIWLIMFDNGLLGTAIYLAFFAAIWWRLRSAVGPIATAGRLVTILTVFYTFFYNNLPTSLGLSMISIALAIRELPRWESPPAGHLVPEVARPSLDAALATVPA